jgi:hypothetical protein
MLERRSYNNFCGRGYVAILIDRDDKVGIGFASFNTSIFKLQMLQMRDSANLIIQVSR